MARMAGKKKGIKIRKMAEVVNLSDGLERRSTVLRGREGGCG